MEKSRIVDYRALGKRLRQFREGIGLSMGEMAVELEVGYTQYQNWESGKPIPFDQVIKIWRRFGVDPRWLTDGFGVPPDAVRKPTSEPYKAGKRHRFRS
jgi:transcriptional regulator with XRE-family HTH domain